MKKRFTRILALGLVSVLSIASITGCSSSSSDSSDDTAEEAAQEEAAAETEEAAEAEEAEEAEEESAGAGTAEVASEMYDSVVLAQNTDVTSMNPWVAGTSSYTVIAPEIYETLGAYDSFGGTFYGVLMSDWEQTAEDTYQITLYDYIYDSDGNHITASDVVFSCEQCWAKGELSETAIVSEVNAIDDYTVEFVFNQTCGLGDFETVMTDIYIVSQAAYEASEDEMITTPVGTGPYRLVEYVTGVSVTIEATENYWQEEELWVVPTQYSNVKTIRVDVISESSQLATALQTGSIAVSDSIEGENATQFLDSDGYGVYTYVDANGRSVIANMSDDSPLSDENLRKAVFYAIDQETVMAFVNGGDTVALATFGSTPYADYDEDWNEGNFTYDVDLAKEYLAASDYADGVTLVLNIIQGKEADEEAALVLQEELAVIGITLEINTYATAQFLALQGDSTAWDLQLNGFPTYTGYLANAWQKYFDLNTLDSDETKNFMSDETLQSLIEACVALDTYGEESYDAFVEYLQDNAVLKGLYAPTKYVIYDSSIIEEVVMNQANYMVPGAFTYVQ